jgi:hypothetical protein
MSLESSVAVAEPKSDVKDEQAEQLVDYCSRPSCRGEFRRGAGPGRRQAYCSEICRRAAERELRQLRARLAHFEGLVEQLRADEIAFGKNPTGDAESSGRSLDDSTEQAASALNRASGVLVFLADSVEPLANELRLLHDAVAPLVSRPT